MNLIYLFPKFKKIYFLSNQKKACSLILYFLKDKYLFFLIFGVQINLTLIYTTSFSLVYSMYWILYMIYLKYYHLIHLIYFECKEVLLNFFFDWNLLSSFLHRLYLILNDLNIINLGSCGHYMSLLDLKQNNFWLHLGFHFFFILKFNFHC